MTACKIQAIVSRETLNNKLSSGNLTATLGDFAKAFSKYK